jgi:hypothetical protein
VTLPVPDPTPDRSSSWERLRRHLLPIGVGMTILILWNGVCDGIYGYSSRLSGVEYFSSEVVTVIRSADGRPHWMVLLAQTAGWLYPLYALTYYPWWVGMRRAGFWLAHLPLALLTYAVLMIGGIQHAGWAFLSVLEQAKAVTGSTDPTFYSLADRYVLQHFVMGDLTAVLALALGATLHAIGILSGKTEFPRWYVAVSPLGVLVATLTVGALLPAPLAGVVLAPFGTWFLLVPALAGTLWLARTHPIRSATSSSPAAGSP